MGLLIVPDRLTAFLSTPVSPNIRDVEITSRWLLVLEEISSDPGGLP